MLTWMHANFATLVISLAMLLLIAAALRSVIRDKKRGRSSCGSCGGCAGCAGCAACGSRSPRGGTGVSRR